MVFYGQAAQVLLQYILQTAVPGATGQQIAAGFAVGINLLVFGLRQVVHAKEFQASEQTWDEKDDVATALSVTSSVFDTVRRQCVSIGMVTPVPPVKLLAVAGLACSGLMKTTVDGARTAELKPLKDKKKQKAQQHAAGKTLK